MGNYFVFERNCVGRWIDTRNGTNQPPVKWLHWRKGSLLPSEVVIPKPLTFDLEPLNPHSADDSPHMPSYLRAAAPIFRDDLIQALIEAGVNNLDCHEAALYDPDNGQTYTNYKVVNIIGLIAAADMNKSVATINGNGPPIIDVDFDKLVIDERKTLGARMFRLAESTNAILVCKEVKEHLEQRGFDDLAFYQPERVAL